MDIDSSSNTTSLLTNEQERRSEIRKRNRAIVLIVLSVVIAIALVTGGVIGYLVRVQYLREKESYAQESAVRHFCSASMGVNYLEQSNYYECIALLSNHVDIATPNNIFLLSLEKTYNGLSNVIAVSPEICLSSLSHALSHVSESLEVIKVNSDLESLSYEEMRSLKVAMGQALGDIGSCVNDTRKGGLKGEDEVRFMVHSAMQWMRYGNNFLLLCDRINKFFRYDLENYGGGSSRIVEDFLQVSLFGSQYLVIGILFWVFFRH